MAIRYTMDEKREMWQLLEYETGEQRNTIAYNTVKIDQEPQEH